MSAPLLTLPKFSVYYGPVQAIHGIELHVGEGEIVTVIAVIIIVVGIVVVVVAAEQAGAAVAVIRGGASAAADVAEAGVAGEVAVRRLAAPRCPAAAGQARIEGG